MMNNLAGQKFGKLKVLERAGADKWKSIMWRCMCDCGNESIVRGSTLLNGGTKSCGCLKTFHEMSHTPTYNTWRVMKDRCKNSHNIKYQYYGERGIAVCERWNNFKNFLEDMGEKPKGLTVERIDNDGDYTPDNCKWATYKEQARNNRRVKLDPLKVQVIKKLLAESRLKQYEIADIFKINSTTVCNINTGRIWADISLQGENNGKHRTVEQRKATAKVSTQDNKGWPVVGNDRYFASMEIFGSH